MAATEDARNAAGVSAPEALACTLRSLAGPFARATLALPRLRFSLANTTGSPVRMARAACDPLRDERGQDCAGTLRIESDVAEAGPGESIRLSIAGRVPAQPGSYASTVHVVTDTGENLAIPLTVGIAASPLWGFLLLLLGLSTIATINVLARQSAVDDARASIARFRQQVHEVLEQTPPPLSRAAEVPRLDRDLDAALASLQRPRAWSFRDTRVTEADDALAEAKARWTRLQSATNQQSPGTAPLGELQTAWDAFGKSLEPPARLPAADDSGLAAALAGFLDRLRGGLLTAPAREAQAQLAPRIQRARLLYLAGDNERGRRSAVAAQQALMRAAAFAEDRVALLQRYAALTDGMLASARIAGALADRLPQRDALEQALHQAAAGLGGAATLDDLRAANAVIEQTRTRALRLAAEAMLARMRAAVDGVARTLNTDAVDQVWADLAATPHPSAEQKRAGLRRVLDAWRGIAGSVPGAAGTTLNARVDAVGRALDGPDLAASGAPYHALAEAWADHVKQQQLAAANAIGAPFCRILLSGLAQDLDVLDRMRASFPAGAEPAGWEPEIDRIRRGLASAPGQRDDPGACISHATTLDGAETALSAAMFRAALRDAPIPLDARLDAARQAGDAEAEALVRSLISDPRPLRISVRTPPGDRSAARVISFGLEGLDPLWGSSVRLTLDWGDGTPPLQADADAIRHGAVLEHAFAQPVTETLHVIARDTEGGPVLGEASLSLPIDASPVSVAQRLAERLFNTRFLLALGVAVLIWLWRFHAGRRLFGARAVDYVEAFALGVAMDAIVADLPVLLSKTFGG